MTARSGIIWLGWVLAGPTLWAAVFTAVYGLHGLGCAWGWTSLTLGPLSLHRGLMAAVWIVGLAAATALLAVAPRRGGREGRILRLGLWIGLVATAFTLAPLVVASSC